MVSFEVLSTGSAGNAVIVGREALVDCGAPFRLIEPHLKDLKLILLTHIHGDHFRPSTLRRIALERPGMRFGACEWLMGPLVKAGVPERQIDLLRIGEGARYSFCDVFPFPLKHDVPNCGYKLFFPGGKAFSATDTADLNGIRARNYDLYLIEANYEDDEIRQRIADKKAEGQYAYEKRVLRTHLSRAQCEAFIAENMGPTGQYVYLHQHMEKEGAG